MKPEVVTPVDERRAALELVDEEAEEVRLMRVVYAFYASFGNNTTAVRLKRKRNCQIRIYVKAGAKDEAKKKKIYVRP